LAKPVYYAYPINKWVSFRVIAENHIRELRKYHHVTTFDEEAVTTVLPIIMHTYGSPIIVHPFFYPMAKYEKYIKAKLGNHQHVIGVDVADSNHITQHAVELTELAEALIAPSNYVKNTYVNSGCKKPIYVIPHGVEEDWIDRTIDTPTHFKQLFDYKQNNNKKLMQLWILHSPYRKGEDLAYEIFNTLVNERKDVALVVRRPLSIDLYEKPIEYTFEKQDTLIPSQQPLTIKSEADLTITVSWLKEVQIEELMAICDIFLLTSRGGGFEHPPLLSIAKGNLAIGARGGAWEDYLPQWLLVDSHESGQILPANPIHDGTGVEMNIDKAVDKLHEILDNIDEYKQKLRKHIDDRIRAEFIWPKIGIKLKEVVNGYI
jgi:glycosyltransferase involved in cell wall biosynthesis